MLLDRDRIADLGLDLASVGRELGTLLGGAYVNRFNYSERSYKVIPQIGDADRATLEPLLDLKIKTPSGEMIPASTFTRIETAAAPRTLNRFQQANDVRVIGGVQRGVTKAETLDVVLEAAARKAGGADITIITPASRGRSERKVLRLRRRRLRAGAHLLGARRAVPELTAAQEACIEARTNTGLFSCAVVMGT